MTIPHPNTMDAVAHLRRRELFAAVERERRITPLDARPRLPHPAVHVLAFVAALLGFRA